jgi:phage shock protein C
MTNKFLLDRPNGKLMGVWAGLSRMSGIDVTLLRLGVVISLFVAGPFTILLYALAGLIAPEGA